MNEFKQIIQLVAMIFTLGGLVGIALIMTFYGIKQLIKYLKK